jgi:DNA polymerase-3 subunit alpha
MLSAFIHLRVHTEYSLRDGLATIDELIALAAANQMPAIAVTDQSNLFASVKFYKSAIAAGIKPIIGVDCFVQNPQQKSHPFRLTLLCQNTVGYKNLTQLISRSYLENQHDGIPCLKKEWMMTETCEGLIALSGGYEGDIADALFNHPQETQSLINHWSILFPDRFYIELQRTGRVNEENYIQSALDLAEKNNIPVVATNDVRFLQEEDFEAHEARVCIQDGFVLSDARRPRLYNAKQYLRTQEEMQVLFQDIPEALENTVEIAKRCNVELILNKTFLPNFPVPQDEIVENYFIHEAEKGLEKKWPLISKNKSEITTQLIIYQERLKTELSVINQMGFAGYFLIVADFIRWAKENGVPVGPGRGSGAGSLVAYVLGITDIDPLQYDLLFERFLNPERVSLPDFDVDFCMEGRDRVIEYVEKKYGREVVAQIITYGTMAARAVVRDVGRVLDYPYTMVDKLAKLIPHELEITLEKALLQEEELKRRYETEDDVRVLFDLAQKLEGRARNAGKHAGGLVIAPSKLINFTALYCEENGEHQVTQFDKDDIESVGLVKFDFLGLRTLTIIDWAVRAINETREEKIDITQIPLNDAKTFSLIKSCRVTAVFQLESRGMKDLIKRLKPDCFEEIIALVALYRPGPLQSGMVDDFIDRKHGKTKVDFFYASLESILKPTYGIILYQEQVMQIAQVLARYTLGGADILRRAMGKKKAEEMAEQRSIFVKGAEANGVQEKLAEHIFDLMEKFAGYGFNKSHSAAYALITYQTAWLKTHYPAEFMAAVLSSDMDNTDKVVIFLEDARAMGLKILPVNINHSQYKFTVNSIGEIVYGLGAIKGVGEAAIESILAERKKSAYKNIFDFCDRNDLSKINRRVLEALIRSGSFDVFQESRAQIFASLESAIQAADQNMKTRESGQSDLFGNHSVQVLPPKVASVSEWTVAQRLQGEKETLGFYLTGHPIQKYEAELAKFISSPLAELTTGIKKTVMIAGWVTGIRTLFTKRGDKIAIVTLEDQSTRLELAVFSEAYASYKELINKDQLLIAEGEVSFDEFTGNYKVMAREIFSIVDARKKFARYLLLKVNAEKLTETLLNQLQQNLQAFRKNGLPVLLQYHQEERQGNLRLGPEWKVEPHEDLLNKIEALLGEGSVEVAYQ